MRVVLDGVATYKCDFCRRNFTAEGAPHVALQVGERSGTVSRKGRVLPGWRFERVLKPGGYHFCRPDEGGCAQAFLLAVFTGSPAPAEYVG